MITYFLIYVIGFIITAIILRYTQKMNSVFDDSDTYGSNLVILVGCLLAWPLTLIFMGTVLIVVKFIVK
jgi:hypothetical protein